MRKKREKQRPLSPQWPDHQLAHELKVISRILDDNPQTLELIVQDLSDRVDSGVGAPGLTAEQVLRCAVIKQLHQFSYRKLEFHLVDSQSCQRFCRLPYGASISKATLAENLGKIEPGTWKAINDHLVLWAQARGLEKGQRIRVDATAVETNIHYPLDSELLYDGIRVVTQSLGRLREREGIGFVDHTRRAKRRVLNIRNRRGKKRLDSYRDLIKVASKTAHYAEQALAASAQWSDPLSLAVAAQLAHYLGLLHKVIEQTQRRVLSGEAVAAQEKICSLFEEHTDIIKKSPRENGLRPQGVCQHGRLVADPGLCGGTGESGRQQLCATLLRAASTAVREGPPPERLGWWFCLGCQPALGQRAGGTGCGLFQKVWVDG